MTIEEYCVEMITLILTMTFTGSMISLLIILLKPIIRDRLPKSFQYYMWLSVVIALLLPVSEIITLHPSGDSGLPMETMYDIVQRISDTVFEKPVNLGAMPQDENVQDIPQTAYLPSAAVILYVFWQTGMVLVLAFHIICYASYARRLGRHNRSADCQEIDLLNDLLNDLSERRNALQLYKNPLVETPILIGFLRPAVILPDKKYGDMELQNILMHEITHKKKHDIFVKWLLIFVGALHWFNPLVHLVRREMNKACELACDESVIKRLDRNGMQQYGDTLIAVAADSIRKPPLSIAMFEDKKNLKERLGAIMKQKKYSKRTVIAASIILATIVCVILGFSALYIGSRHNYMDNYSLENRMYMKENELRKVLCNYDKENIEMARVYLEYLDTGEITKAYLFITGREKNPDSEMLDGIRSLASKELELDIQNIYLDYADLESFTLNDFLTQEKYQKEYELRNVLINNYKDNNIAILVSLNYSDDGNITQAYIFVMGQDENPDSEMLSGMRSLASEELELDTQNIFLEYL